MTITKVSLLIPCTSKGRPQWNTMKDSYLYNYTLKTFLLTYTKNPSVYEYHFYIGYDDDDRIYSLETEQQHIHRFHTIFQDVNFHFIPFHSIPKGHVTKMWNILFEQAYNDGCEYFFQCGDDIDFKTKGWIQDSIAVLKQHNNIGLSGPINNNSRILTQAMVSRKHMEIFGFFFPEQIINWCCDDWYNYVYQPNYFYPLKQHFCSNQGGQPRYEINNDTKFKQEFAKNTQILRQNAYILAQEHKLRIQEYLSKN